MNNGWTDERRQRQAALIQSWHPWQRSTGPRTASGKARASRNAFKDSPRQQLREIARFVAEMKHERQKVMALAARDLVRSVSALGN